MPPAETFETRTSLPDSAYRRFGTQPPLHDSRVYIFSYIFEAEMMMPSFILSLLREKWPLFTKPFLI